jgi:hypothetical protein
LPGLRQRNLPARNHRSFKLAFDGNSLGVDPRRNMGTLLDIQVTLDLNLSLEPSGYPNIAISLQLAFDGYARTKNGLLGGAGFTGAATGIGAASTLSIFSLGSLGSTFCSC